MRDSRKNTLGGTGIGHKMWRGHNRENVLESHDEKMTYLGALCRTLTEKIAEEVQWYSYCVMSNHAHESLGVTEAEEPGFEHGISTFGDWMRNAHSIYGAWYNRKHDRQGKVAYDRPKTCEVQDQKNLTNGMIYGDLNPVRAGIVKHPKEYAYSSYNYFAYGKIDDVTKHLTEPEWYLDLGDTAKKRQRAYRQLIDERMRELDLINDAPPVLIMEVRFIGDDVWSKKRRQEVREARAGPSG